jgi:hypothetical protein
MPGYSKNAFLKITVLGLSLLGGFVVPQTQLAATQESLRTIPNDPTRVYYEDGAGKPTVVPFESNTTSLNPFVKAAKDKVGYAELKGPKAATVLSDRKPRFYVFVADKMDPPPHQLVRLTGQKNRRRFTVVTTKGRMGYSPLEVESIRLEYRLLERLRVAGGSGRFLFLNYMELRPRQELAPGEYAIIGHSLLDIATFRIQ